MDSVVVLILVLALVVVAFVLYTFYGRVRLRMRPPESIAVSRKSRGEELNERNQKSHVIGMVNCEYCGSLMPQMETSCPNCGGRRKK